MNKKTNYINEFNKKNYKIYQFRVKKNKQNVINFLDNLENRNEYINSIILNNVEHKILSIKNIKTAVKPILNKYGIHDIYLFGSYSRGEANINSDIDIYCDKGNINNLIDLGNLIEELEKELGKKVDIIFTSTKLNDYFKNQIMEDMIKLC